MTAVLPPQADEGRALRNVFAHFPSGLVVIAALGADGPVGLIASTFTTVSLDPPLISVNIGRSSTTLPSLAAADHWGVSVLSADQAHIADLLRRPAAQRFDGIDWTSSDTGAVHVDGVTAGFGTRVDRIIPAGDHVIALLEVHHHHATGSDPLVFHRSRFRRLENEDLA